MKIRIFADSSLSVDLQRIVDGLNKSVPSIAWSVGTTPFAARERFISNPNTYEKLSTSFRREIHRDDFAFLFTEKPYDNNYFFESTDAKAIIISLFGWKHLTNLPRANGMVYFAAALLVRRLGIGQSHKAKNTGCINDFWYDKTGVDSGMRAAYVCTACLSTNAKVLTRDSILRTEIVGLLDHISHASRAEENILDYWARIDAPAEKATFDVFLCHNSKDKPAVRRVNGALQARQLATWLDEEQLLPGRVWQELLEAQIASIGSVAVFVGPSGLGPWQDVEMRAFISEFVRRGCPVIPVILEGCSKVPQLPLFMQQFTWVDFRKNEPTPLDRLIWGITGTKPVRQAGSSTSPKRTNRKRHAA